MRYKMEKPVVSTLGQVKYQCRVEWRNGTFVGDEPTALGGQDSGPDPFTLLLSALASCKVVTLRMFIEKQGWQVPVIKAAVNLFQVHKGEEITTTIDCDLTFPNAILENEQRDHLLKVAEGCPVSNIIKGNSHVRTFIHYDESELRGKVYANKRIGVEWKPVLCRHSGRCVGQLPGVFKLDGNPWINVDGSDVERLVEQVNRCPTGALSIVEKK